MAKAGRAQAEAALKLTQFNVAVNAADACVTLIAAQETVRAAQGSVDRAEVVVRSTNALVGAELRPGADASRAQAELAAARTQLIQAQQAVETARATVAQFVGSENPADVVLFAPGLLQLPVDQRVPPLDESASPAAPGARPVGRLAADPESESRPYCHDS